MVVTIRIARDHQVLGHKSADVEAGLAGARHRHALEGRAIADVIGRFAMRDLPTIWPLSRSMALMVA